jgi:hypothetical protein
MDTCFTVVARLLEIGIPPFPPCSFAPSVRAGVDTNTPALYTGPMISLRTLAYYACLDSSPPQGLRPRRPV